MNSVLAFLGHLLFVFFYAVSHTQTQMANASQSTNDSCDFDDDLKPTCHWHNIGSDLSFIRHSGNTMSHSTGPPGDHSKYQNGSYIYLEASNAQFGSKAQIASKIFKPTVGRTLIFHAYLYGATVNYLKVFIQKKSEHKKELWKVSGNKGQKWIEVKLRILSLKPYQIIFEAAVGRNFQSDVAIDDVMFFNDKVATAEWSEWNSWTTCQIKDNWCQKERFRVCIRDDCKSPDDEETRLEKEIATCHLSHCRVDGHWSSWNSWSQCLSDCGNGERRRLRRCDEPSPKFGGHECPGKDSESMPCWSGFCKVGADDCDFDDDNNPFCLWKNVNNSLAFRRKYLWTGTAGTGPQGDHSNNTHGKYIYLETSLPAKHGQYARLISREMKATESRTLKFYTYMFGRSVNYLRVLIRTKKEDREIWKLKGNHGRKWILGRVDYACHVPYQIIFEAAVGKDFQSDIAIDTIHFQEAEVRKAADESSSHQLTSRGHKMSLSKIIFQTSLAFQFVATFNTSVFLILLGTFF